jgi:hypothetical protein
MTIDHKTSTSIVGANSPDGLQVPHSNFVNNTSTWTSIGTSTWHFPNNWKFLSGYDYPVLNWQTRAPADPSSF